MGDREALERVRQLSSSLASILRPQAAYRWILPYLAALTPQYIEGVLRGALAGNHVQAWELFDLMIDTDPEIAACVQEYVEGVQGKSILVEPYHEEDQEPSAAAMEKQRVVSAALRNFRPEAQADENDIAGTVRDVIFARFHGQSLLEIDWHDPKTETLHVRFIPEIGNIIAPRATWWVHPVCFGWDLKGRLGLRVAEPKKETRDARGKPKPILDPSYYSNIVGQAFPPSVTEFPPNKFLLSIFKSKTGTALGGSCLRPLAWWWIASNFCGDWLLKHAELWGVPFRMAQHSGNVGEPALSEIRSLLAAAGANGYLLAPEGVSLELLETSTGGGQSPQAFLFQFADAQKRKVILHQTMTGGAHDSMGKGGGKAFGEVESGTKWLCIYAGARHVESVLNLQLVPMILNLNYGDGGDLEAPAVKLVDVEEGGLLDAQRDTQLMQMVDVPASYVRRKYNLPKPKPGEPVAGSDEGAAGRQAQPDALARLFRPNPATTEEWEQSDEREENPEASELDDEGKEFAASARHQLTAIRALPDAQARRQMARALLRDAPPSLQRWAVDGTLRRFLSLGG